MGTLSLMGFTLVFFALVGAMLSAATGGLESWIWLVGVAAGAVLIIVAVVYSLKFLAWPGLILLGLSLGASALSVASGSWVLPGG